MKLNFTNILNLRCAEVFHSLAIMEQEEVILLQ